MKSYLKNLCLFAVLLVYSVTTSALTLRFAHSQSTESVSQEMAVYFKQEMELRSYGEIQVEIFPMGQLGTDRQMLNRTKSGAIDIVMVGINNFSEELPEAAVFTLPFIFPDRDSAYKVLDSEVGKEFLIRMQDFGLKGLGYPENGFRSMTNNRGPIKVPQDVAGLKMRVNSSKVLSDMFALLGATPIPIPVVELYAAFDSGLVNAQDHPVCVVMSQEYYYVQRYLSLTRHAYSPLALAMNNERYEKLTPSYQKMLFEVTKEAIDMQRKWVAQKEGQTLEFLEDNGMIINDDVDKAAFQEAVKPVWDRYIQKYGAEPINKIRAILD